MRKIIRTYKNNIIISEDFSKKYIEYKKLEKELKPMVDTMKSELMKTMTEFDRTSVVSNGISVSMTKGYEKESIDTELLKTKYPSIYAELKKVSVVKPSLTLKVNG